MFQFRKIFALALTACLPALSCAAGISLHDIKGDYAGYELSVSGGLAAFGGPTSAQTSVLQLSIDKHGNGSLNFFSSTLSFGATDNGPFPAFFNITSPVGISAPFSVTIDQPSIGAGTMFFADFPLPTDSITQKFVCQTHQGKVQEIYRTVSEFNFNNIQSGPNPTYGLTTVLKRQD